jgi:hypothetical protein
MTLLGLLASASKCKVKSLLRDEVEQGWLTFAQVLRAERASVWRRVGGVEAANVHAVSGRVHPGRVGQHLSFGVKHSSQPYALIANTDPWLQTTIRIKLLQIACNE